MITIIDYKIGNLGSIANMLKKIGIQSIITSNISDIKRAKKLVLPGVGAFDNGMKNLKDLNILEVLNEKVLLEKTPILGICLGTQLFTKGSEEGNLPGLGWMDATTVKFDTALLPASLKIPNMGWNYIKIKKESPLFKEAEVENKFYFVHSYHLKMNQPSDVLATAEYGYEYTVALERDNIVGVQFHPEKSHKFGMNLLKNFAENY